MSGLDEDDKGEVERDDDVDGSDEESTELAEDYGEDLDEDELDQFSEADEDLKVVDEALSHKDQNARALAIRRAIEERMEAKRLSQDLDYLDLDLDSDD